MSDNDNFEGPEAPFTITLKGGAGYEKPWLVLRAASAEDAVALLGEAHSAELLDRIAEYAAEFQGKTGAAAPSAAGTKSGGSPSSPRGASSRGSSSRGAAAPKSQQQSSDVEYHPEGVTCPVDNEVVVYKEINSRGKKYELWVCPNQRSKGDGHFSEFIN